MAKIKDIEQTVTTLVSPVAEQLGVQLWDVRFVKEGSEYYLRITLDKDGGIDITDCETFSRAADPIIDAADPINVAYYFEVSSPGLGRPLTRPEHFEKLMGQEIKVGLYSAVDGQKEFVGNLVGYNGDVTIETETGSLTLEKSKISSVKLNDDADLF